MASRSEPTATKIRTTVARLLFLLSVALAGFSLFAFGMAITSSNTQVMYRHYINSAEGVLWLAAITTFSGLLIRPPRTVLEHRLVALAIILTAFLLTLIIVATVRMNHQYP